MPFDFLHRHTFHVVGGLKLKKCIPANAHLLLPTTLSRTRAVSMECYTITSWETEHFH